MRRIMAKRTNNQTDSQLGLPGPLAHIRPVGLTCSTCSYVPNSSGERRTPCV